MQFLHADNEYFDQYVRMCRLIWAHMTEGTFTHVTAQVQKHITYESIHTSAERHIYKDIQAANIHRQVSHNVRK